MYKAAQILIPYFEGTDMVENTEAQKRRWSAILRILILMLLAGSIGGLIGRSWKPQVNSSNQSFSSEVVLSDEGLTFKNKKGRVIAKLSSSEHGGFLLIYNSSEKPAADIGVSADGGGLIGLTNGKGLGDTLRLTGNEDGASLFLVSSHGKRGIELSTDDDGGLLSVNGPTGDPSVTIETTGSGKGVHGQINVFEPGSNRVLWAAPRK